MSERGNQVDMTDVVRVEGVSRNFGRGRRVVHAVRDVSFTAGAGQLVAIRGRSGAGKTTLLNMIGGLDRPDSGRVFLGSHEISAASERTLLTLLANDPKLLIADEPTGQLDSETGRSIMDLLRAVVKARGMTALVATHDPALLDRADRVITLRDGAVVADELTAGVLL